MGVSRAEVIAIKKCSGSLQCVADTADRNRGEVGGLGIPAFRKLWSVCVKKWIAVSCPWLSVCNMIF